MTAAVQPFGDVSQQGIQRRSAAQGAERKGMNGQQAPMVFPTGGDLQTGSPTYNGAPQQGQGTPAAAKPGAQAAPQTFRTLQMAGMARPAPPPPPPAPGQGGTQGMVAPMSGGTPGGMPQQPAPQYQGNSAVSQLLQQMIANPTAYDDSVIQAQRTAGMGRLDQQSAMDKARLDEEMAGRGLFSSTIAQGRLGDININRTNAIADMEAGFLKDRASSMDAGRRAAAELGLQSDRNSFDQWLGGQNLGLDRERMEKDDAYKRDDLAFRREDSTLDRGQRASEFDRNFGLDTQKFGEDRRQFDTTEGRLGSQFDRTYGLDRDRFNRDSYEFDTEMGYKDRALGEDTRRFDMGYGLDRDRFGLDKDRQRWDQNIDYYDRYSSSDLLDPSTQYGGGTPQPPAREQFRSAREWSLAMRDWVQQYGGG